RLRWGRRGHRRRFRSRRRLRPRRRTVARRERARDRARTPGRSGTDGAGIRGGAEARPGGGPHRPRLHGLCPVPGPGRRGSGLRFARSHSGGEGLMTTGFSSWLRVQWDRGGAVGAALAGLGAGALVALFFRGRAVALWPAAVLRDEWREPRALRLILSETAPETARAGAGL